MNNQFLVVATLIVFLGQLLPILHIDFGLGSLSIGVPFFTQMFAIIIVPFASWQG
ncbi:cytochrome c-type biogenesis CcmF C-terminal domain-containing protein [Pseudoalteromonas piscicida]|uniref:cytochrome c-type biogenesis CcmF C-terminal domain-containing protein n=1 Tax=Pseudoalteromonas piscicida TaxID=43662 RepID=UPI003D33077E